jgi:hypothetical protein
VADCIQALITANIKSALADISTAGGYNYDVNAVEEMRTVLEIDGREPFVLITEQEPQIDSRKQEVSELEYIVWFFPEHDDELTGVPAIDENSELGHYCRNVPADINKALQVEPYRGGYARRTEVVPIGLDIFVGTGMVSLDGYSVQVTVKTSIDMTDPYKLR